VNSTAFLNAAALAHKQNLGRTGDQLKKRKKEEEGRIKQIKVIHCY
jgi:hypothetical protein